MRKRKSFNPKRSICSQQDTPGREEVLRDLVRRVSYGGNPEHKKNPGDFGLQPPSSPRLGKTLCDSAGILTRAEALRLLRDGLKKGLISSQQRGGWPQNVWAVTADGSPLEAQLEGDGVYHGYPMPENDPFRAEVLKRWGER
ncbi:MAG: hypothetical protein M1541_08370 [Acidobacteria bacterium]|nr:hypothetical protein [Acidobacteriota bacterium]